VANSPDAPLLDVAGRIILVTGASSGLGWHFSEVLAARGARVVAVARRMDRLEQLRDIVRAGGGAIDVLACDVAEDESILDTVGQVEEGIGPIDVLVNNAGTSVPKPFLEQTRADWDRVLDTNLDGAWLMAQAVARRMAARGRGSIINISSVAALAAFPLAPGYGAAKAALINLTKSMAVALAPMGVRVNVIAPGLFDTELGKDLKRTPDDRRRRLERIPMARVGEHRELDGVLLLLASDASSYMTGSVIVVDGGSSILR
jgi:NAD(P)-dependent dehydrogenase (short-subunit alcohol dehydrogenase family)